MAFVDLGQLGYYTLSENAAVTMWNFEDQEFQPGQWYRSAPWLDKDNSPGVSIVIGDTGSWPNRSGETVWIDEDGKVNIALTVVNVGSGTAAVGFPAVGRITVKVYVVFDDAGRIQAISHPTLGRNGGSPTPGRFLPHLGQHVAALQVPAEVSGLTPRQLHDAVRDFTPACPV